jgi:hypothetical protein
MIHRIDRVNPDVDDRVIKPNEARDAKNLRFGASVEDTNLSGGILITGNEQLQYAVPSGDNLVVGVMDDFEAQVVYFALYNNNSNHGIYRIKGSDNSIDRIVSGNWLNFTPTMNVSMASIDGKLYWTDNLNQPKMVNVEKGIRTQKLVDGITPQVDTYPLPTEEWFYTQIKRQPGLPLQVTPQPEQNLEWISETGLNKSPNKTGQQYSYYYIYDNNEESRLAPYSINTYGYSNISLTIPPQEYNDFLNGKNLVKYIVFVIRYGNDSPWNLISTIENNSSFTGTYVLPSTVRVGKGAIASNVTNARFDSVPLVSITNEIAQNKINHGNYIIDYSQLDGIELDVNIQRIFRVDPDSTVDRNPKRTFVPWGEYRIGLEFVDAYGRTIPVRYYKQIQMPIHYAISQNYAPQGNPEPVYRLGDLGFTSDPEYNRFAVEFKIKGDLPDWVAKVNVVKTKCLNITSYNRTMANVYFWYSDAAGNNVLVYGSRNNPVNQNINWSTLYNSSYSERLQIKGIAFELSMNEPFIFDNSGNQYVYIYYNHSVSNTYGDYNTIGIPVKFKVSAQDGRFVYIRNQGNTYPFPNASSDYDFLLPSDLISPAAITGSGYDSNSGNANLNKQSSYYPLFYEIAFTYEPKESSDNTFYGTEVAITRQDYLNGKDPNGYYNGWLYGDFYMCAINKRRNPSTTSCKIYNPGLPGITNQSLTNVMLDLNQDYNLSGEVLSINPIDNNLQNWDFTIGQPNTEYSVEQRAQRFPSNITFSDPLIQGTQINGLNKFNSVDFRQAPLENGPITALVTTNATQREPGVLLAIGTYGISSFYYDSIQLTNVDGESNITTTDKYLASQRPLLGQLGCSQPASITRTPLATVYWWSDIVNDFVRYTNAGLERLGLTYSFGNLLRKNLYQSTSVASTYDQVTDEVSVWSKNNPYYSFSERYKTFQGEREYFQDSIAPERAIGLATKQFQFINGTVWLTDINSTTAQDNFWFGSLKTPSATVVSNEAPSVVKQWNQVKVFGPKPTSTILKTGAIDSADGLFQLISYIRPEWYIERKGDWEAAIRRAEDSSGSVLAGKLMESRILYSIFAFDPTKFNKLNFIEIKSNSAIVQ